MIPTMSTGQLARFGRVFCKKEVHAIRLKCLVTIWADVAGTPIIKANQPDCDDNNHW